MSLEIEKINDYKLTVPRLPKRPKDWKGKKCLDVQYWVMSILGKRRSGKRGGVLSCGAIRRTRDK